jgi:hypothetical protein
MSALPEVIVELLKMGESSVDSRGELPSRFRGRLFDAIESESISEHANAGYYRRVKIEIACACRVLPIWESMDKEGGEARRTLELAYTCLQGKADLTDLEKAKDLLNKRIEDEEYEGNCTLVMAYAGFAVVSALNATIYDIDTTALLLPEQDRAPETWCAAFNASLVLAGGATWESSADDSKRREFWLWYLRKLVPAIWDPFVEPGPVPG